MRASLRLFIPLFAILLASGCGSDPSFSGPEPSVDILAESGASASPSVSAAEENARLLEAAGEVVRALRGRDLNRLAFWIHEEHGVLFSPYRSLDPASSRSFLPDALPQFSDDTKLVWGVYEGTNNPIELTFREYFETFVYDQDFAQAPTVSANRSAIPDGSPYNGQEVFPESSYVEFYFPRQDSSRGWKSLTLVFLPADDDWRLVAVAHGEG